MPSDRLDLEYSPSSAAREPERSLRLYRERGDTARRRLRAEESVPYGDRPGETCHVFPADGSGNPALVFVHGGHWQESGIDDACFAAENAVSQGFAYVAVGYGLAPERTLPDMILSVRRALTWIADRGRSYGVDPGRVHVAGSSAGAHLLACALADPATPRARSALLMSGLYDLTEIPDTYVNDALGLTRATAEECSPLRMPAPRCDSVLLAAGRHETRTYLRQQSAYEAHLASSALPVASHVVPDRDHFDLPLDLADPATGFGRLSLDHLGRVTSPS
ncbi:alpha/beta hydrolase [Nocardiopsis algeriensis]|uniref:Arylformamidase n=1 Tax=Nocardiopsis algeriensis TaxID=1478215 RepID=A0A841IWJ4_9ACTN|nr:alpha/beta hydrolase [Nocardiopsis algeriensis]MBB6120578.1 arylformamidase [Nocardiopsis algeriensis]